MEPLQLFKVLSDQTRLDIVLLLKASGELCVCDIYTALNLSQPKTSRHLAMLRESGLLLDSKHGKWVHYRLSPTLLPWVKNIIEVTYETEKNKIADLLQSIEKKGAVSCCPE
ncbi:MULTISPECIES: metalloregulator ArsR/SmtB family transcription factor [Proteus]|uniref:Metalloregulator ArsR/SmtB family transcription factor n=1 Tax=Proteus penneri TaxID=102862 RepID=A0ABS0VZC6_9GAMM|nr:MULTISPECIES: metalloregulator ArsR/SmtB family transcription factor [Proteus]EEG83339.1 transcriptional regulator, ArsR family [Proteus penneri ATCC 35198]MBJ2116412.1 metalloregulator ArsR/SmtB family transcription factor [Proteus penneri]MCO8050583.1 metalloregulator ArsR/SmtB family transcription factor [Proteus penneri]MCX2587086.1 metalloregulator ArsR/SmtB family transcription factor [Proteus penneri]NBL76982.1 metalloregulator ArsR/SmtB family transcription factor [Proteus sp. G2672